KTVTISGTPTADVSFTVTTIGTSGTPVSGSGDITVSSDPIPPAGNLIHNFTLSDKNSTFYAITGNMNSTDGSVTYDGLSLTKRLKIEQATRIVYTTTAVSSLTLVFDSTFSGIIKLTTGTDITVAANTKSYTAVNGIVTITDLPAATYTINKKDTANLFYIKTEYSNLSTNNVAKENLVIYPNPVVNKLNISVPNNTVEKVTVYNVSGQLVKSVNGNVDSVDLSHLNNGVYLVQVKTKNGVLDKKIIKK
nr:T9SS type A sorting domain-containing protein [Ignavibacteriaceae bacterium]